MYISYTESIVMSALSTVTVAGASMPLGVFVCDKARATTAVLGPEINNTPCIRLQLKENRFGSAYGPA